ncbi:ATP-dependent DNA ligase [Mycoplasmatota bacterium]|nr:ATP-dependent DNA ligase [Mycoplasmatota bacterium]
MTDNVFDCRLARPMLLTDGEPFDSIDYIYELKLDGIRCLAYLNDKTDIRNKRNKNVTSLYPELIDIHKQVSKRCILDGELIVVVNGVPDFFDIQRRSLMTNAFKIELASKSKPVHFVVYDIIYFEDHEIIEKPLIERKKLLKEVVQENEKIVISRFIEEKGIDFYHLVEKQNLEGIVAKKKTSLYYYGKRSTDWVKVKKMFDEDFVICGYVKDENTGGIKSVVLGAYRGDNLIYQGHVALGISKEDAKIILKFAIKNPSNCPFEMDKSKQNEIWIKPELVCIVKYMMRTHTNSLRQPVFKGLRDDKASIECQV